MSKYPKIAFHRGDRWGLKETENDSGNAYSRALDFNLVAVHDTVSILGLLKKKNFHSRRGGTQSCCAIPLLCINYT